MRCLLLFVSALAWAGPADEPMMLDPLAAELSSVDDDAAKALRIADKCLVTDSQRDRTQTVYDRAGGMYEALSSSVVCWQRAEKKAAKLGQPFAPAAGWITARARVVEAHRSWTWALVAKYEGDGRGACRRLASAEEEAAAAKAAAEALTFQTPGAIAMAAGLVNEAQAVVDGVAAELGNQDCGER